MLSIPKIVLYDLAYRTIRFHESYYTISRIVLYDFENRKVGFGESLYTISEIVTVDCLSHKCHTCYWDDAMVIIQLTKVHNHLIFRNIR